ncbi:hypothetical protein [Lapidilactobacillus bayanensis]|uniref:hypothetical protein n=1 Tax=Lapidilactobacillus bayanensis TaxID=2485998 RepID=UPI000F77DC7F|nr:hypothetical protein [Lapidilactobacillus bayanensis]
MKEKTYKTLELIWFATIVIGIIMILIAWNYTLNLILLFWGVLIVCLAYLGYIATDIVDHYIRNKTFEKERVKTKYKLMSVRSKDWEFCVGIGQIKSLYLSKRSDDLKRSVILIEYDNGNLEYQNVEDPSFFYEFESETKTDD